MPDNDKKIENIMRFVAHEIRRYLVALPLGPGDKLTEKMVIAALPPVARNGRGPFALARKVGAEIAALRSQ